MPANLSWSRGLGGMKAGRGHEGWAGLWACEYGEVAQIQVAIGAAGALAMAKGKVSICPK